MSIETDISSAAALLKVAIDQALAAGYRVSWPLRATDIDKIAISETARTIPAAPYPPPSDTPRALKGKVERVPATVVEGGE